KPRRAATSGGRTDETPAHAGVSVFRHARDNLEVLRLALPMNPLRWSFRSRFLIAAAICFALIGFAIYSQLQWGLEPCPLCIFQRIAFAALGLVFLLGGVLAPKGAGGRRVWSWLAFVAAAVGIGIAGRHAWIQLNPPPIPSCGAPFAFLRETLDT